MKKLLDFYSTTGIERVGFILTDGTIIEVKNCHPDPGHHFDVSAKDLIDNEDRLAATWHTHPDGNSNLSLDDQAAFAMYPDLKHYIVGNDGVRGYHFDGHVLVQQYET